MIVEKDKLPKGMSYALKTAMLTELLEENGLIMPVSLDYKHSDLFFEANYIPYCDKTGNGRLRIRVGSVPSDQCQAAREYIHNTVFPQFVQWMNERNSLPDRSTKQFGRDNSCFLRYYSDQE